MKTGNAMQLKARINNKSKELSVPPQIMLQNYLMECFLERLEKSEYADRFIIKGGVLIASFVGISHRTTMDIDTTVNNLPLDENVITKIISDVCAIENDDDFIFSPDRVEPIREDDKYNGFRVFVLADYEKMHHTLTLDITAGDSIYPKPRRHEFAKIFETGSISLLSYPLENVLAEKLETILARNITTTRPRDFYDVYVLSADLTRINSKDLKTAMQRTCEHRGSEKILSQIPDLIVAIKKSENLKDLWQKYTKKMPYAANVSFEQAVASVEKLLDLITNLSEKII
jgi:predicted nucleotidyltransferase component of viral defense system